MKTVIDGKMCTLSDGTLNGPEERIKRLEDIQSISEILYHYTRCVDRKDFEGIASCYTEDGCFIPGDQANAIEGKESILAIFKKLMDPEIKTSVHMINNQQINFIANDEALVYAYFYANKSFKSEREDEETWGGYELRVVCERDEEWRIKSHKVFFTRQDGSKTGRFGEHEDRPWPPIPEYKK